MLPTISEISRTTGYESHRLRRVVRSRNISPTLRLGELGALLFDDAAANRIVEELDAIVIKRIPLATEILC